MELLSLLFVDVIDNNWWWDHSISLSLLGSSNSNGGSKIGLFPPSNSQSCWIAVLPASLPIQYHTSVVCQTPMCKALKIWKLLFWRCPVKLSCCFFPLFLLIIIYWIHSSPIYKKPPFLPVHTSTITIALISQQKKWFSISLGTHFESCPIKYANQIMEFNFWWKEQEGNFFMCPPQDWWLMSKVESIQK